MSANLTIQLTQILETRSLRNKRVTICDPDNRRIYQTYEDLEEVDANDDRLALITLHPEHARASANGDDGQGLIVLNHQSAVADLRAMIVRHSFVVTRIERDIYFDGVLP